MKRLHSDHTVVYRFDGEEWQQLGAAIGTEAGSSISSEAVSLSGDGSRVLISSRGTFTNRKQARVYEFDGIDWVQLGTGPIGEVPSTGGVVSISLSRDGNTAAIGVPFNNDAGTWAGQVRVFRFDGTAWFQVGQNVNGEAERDESGHSVALSADGNTLIIGAGFNDGNGLRSGHARVLRFDGATWNQLGEDVDGEAAGDLFGESVDISSDGRVALIGATGNSGNGHGSGHTRSFVYHGSEWLQLGDDIDGEAPGDHSGFSVAVSGDSQTTVIGAIGNNFVGHARIFRLQAVATGTIVDDDLHHSPTLVSNDNGSIVTIRDAVTGGKKDRIKLSIDGDHLVVADQTNAIGNLSDRTFGNSIRVSLDRVQEITVDLGSDDDELLIEFNGAPQNFDLSITIIGGDGNDVLTFVGENRFGAGDVITNGDIETIVVDGPISTQLGTVMLRAARGLELNASINVGSSGTVILDGGEHDVFGNCSLIDAGDADVHIVAGTGIAGVRIRTTGNVTLDAGSGGIAGCERDPGAPPHVDIEASRLTLIAGASAGTALLQGGVLNVVKPLRTRVTTFDGNVGGLGIFVENDGSFNADALVSAGYKIVGETEPAIISEGEGAPRQNANNRLDVNDDGSISAIDVLMVVNYLNTGGNSVHAEGPSDRQVYVDVSGDQLASALDALLVVNYLNSSPLPQAEGEALAVDLRSSQDSNSLISMPKLAASEGKAATKEVSIDASTPVRPSAHETNGATMTRRDPELEDEDTPLEWEAMLDDLAMAQSDLKLGSN